MTAPARWPNQGTDAEAKTDAKLEALVADATESFRATVGIEDGTRSAQIVTWSRLFARAVERGAA